MMFPGELSVENQKRNSGRVVRILFHHVRNESSLILLRGRVQLRQPPREKTRTHQIQYTVEQQKRQIQRHLGFG